MSFSLWTWLDFKRLMHPCHVYMKEDREKEKKKERKKERKTEGGE